MEGTVPINGGLPTGKDDQTIGGVGVAGVPPNQEAQSAAAGLAALK